MFSRRHTLEGMLSPLRRGICLADDGGGGGGGGGSDDDKPMSRKEVTELLNKTVTGAMKNWEGRLTKDLDTKLSTLGEELVKKIAPAGAGGGGEPAGKGTPGASDSETAKELARMKADRDADAKRIKALEEAGRQKDQELEESTFRAGMQAALTKAGVKPSLMNAAMALHKNSGKFKVKKGALCGTITLTGGVEDDDVPADKAIEEWVKSEEGKQFLAPVDAGGTGDGRSPRAGGAQPGAGVGLLSKDPNERALAAMGILSQPGS